MDEGHAKTLERLTQAHSAARTGLVLGLVLGLTPAQQFEAYFVMNKPKRIRCNKRNDD